jgi:hypothetical protein
VNDSEPLKMISVCIPISREMLEGLRAPTEQKLAEYRAKAEARAAERRAEVASHEAMVAAASGLLLQVLTLHAPVQDTRGLLSCHGCDYGGYDAEPPEWPCRTYVLARDAEEAS